MKKILAVILALVLSLGYFVNFEKAGAEEIWSVEALDVQSDKSEQSEHKNLSEEEMVELSEIAKTYYKNAQFVEMMDAYQKLYDGGCQDASLFGFSTMSVEDALKTWEEKVARDKIVCEYVSYVIASLKKALKDPNSLVIYSIHLEEDKTETNKLCITLDYGARNSFGGMVRDSFSQTYSLSKKQLETIYSNRQTQAVT